MGKRPGNDSRAKEKQEKKRTTEGEGDNYVVFPRSIFFWIARAEW